MHNRKHQISTPAAQQDTLDASSVEAQRPDPEVVPGAKRRAFSKAEKLRILAAADACVAPGEIGALLRLEGIYSSHLATWRKLRQPEFRGHFHLINLSKGEKNEINYIHARISG
ncbi:MAG: hypothetical protein ACEQSK_15670 [Sphingomonadaceae bacterium]